MCTLLESQDIFADLQTFLLNYRSTPHASTGISPFEALFSRKMNNLLPTLEEKTSRENDLNSKLKNKIYADKRRKVKI